MKKLLLSGLCVSLTVIFASLGVAQTHVGNAAPPYHAFIWDSVNGMQDLGTLGGNNSYAIAINDGGTVTGYSDITGNARTHAFVWTATGGMVDIGATVPGGGPSEGLAINSAGNVGGTLTRRSNNLASPAFWSAATGWQAKGRDRGDQRNYAFGINDSNQLTGQLYVFGDVVHAFLWDETTNTITSLPTLPGGLHTVGNSINNLTHITGTGSASDSLFDAIFWSATGGTQDIGRLNGSDYTAGVWINVHDEVVGLNGNLEGFYWSQATGMLPLQTLGSNLSPAFGINDSGVIAGYSSIGTLQHACIWPDHNSAPVDLGTLGGSGSVGRAINNSGQVAGYSLVP